MIRSKDVNFEVKKLELKIEQSPSSVGLVDVLKGICLLVKVLRDVKTNQVTIMRSTNVKLIEPRLPSKDGDKTEDKNTKKEV